MLHASHAAANAAIELILADVVASPPDDDRWLVYESAKRQLTRLVGWSARSPALRSSEAWGRTLARLEDVIGRRGQP